MTMQSVKESLIRASAETVFAFREAKDAFERLPPPWQKTVIVTPPSSLARAAALPSRKNRVTGIVKVNK